MRILSPPEEAGKHEVYEISFTANGSLRSNPLPRGAREHLTVVEGVLTVTSGEAPASLKPGDTARYAADLPHRIEATGGEARAFLVVINA